MTVINLQFTDHTRVVPFADDLILMIRADSTREAENIANKWKKLQFGQKTRQNFNEEKSIVMLVTRRKRKENKKY
jgi:hypothetical protein